MPAKAKAMMDGIITISQDAVFKLETEPNGTIEYVKLLSFLDEIQEKVCKGTISVTMYVHVHHVYINLFSLLFKCSVYFSSDHHIK